MIVRKPSPQLLMLLLCLGMVSARMVLAQATGEFLCSAGTKDGQPCNTDDDCPGGVCVISQGVCNGGDDDGLPCDCPSGSCSAQATCFDPSSVSGSCTGGPYNGQTCACNCAGGIACIGSQRVCVGGTNTGFSCLNNPQCPGGQCLSTGLFCGSDTDFPNFTCGADADCCTPPTVCPPGSCQTTVVAATATATAVRTPTPIRTATAPRPTATGSVVPSPTNPPTAVAATRTPTRTVFIGTPSRTPTLAPGSTTVAVDEAAGSTRVVLTDASMFPLSGMIQVGDDRTAIPYTKEFNGNTLHLTYPLNRDVAAGTIVRLAPGDGGVIDTSTAQGAGCAIGSTPRSEPLSLTMVLLLLCSAGYAQRVATRLRARRDGRRPGSGSRR